MAVAAAGLRVAALLVLAVWLARPVMLRATSPNEHGPVLVLVDSSGALGVVDGGRRGADLIALADGLGMLPERRRARARRS